MVLLEFIKSLGKHWWALMSCAVFTFIGVVVLYFNENNKWALWATFGAAVGMLLVASFLTWKSQYDRVGELESRWAAPDIRVRIESLWNGTVNIVGVKKFMLVVVASAVNAAGPPSVVSNWIVKIKRESDQKVFIGEFPYISGHDIKKIDVGGGLSVRLSPDQALLSKSHNPIPPGGLNAGWLFLVFPDVDPDHYSEDKWTVTLSAEDVVTSRRHESSAGLGIGRGVTLPGIGLVGGER